MEEREKRERKEKKKGKKRRPIHPNLMVREDARKAIRSNKILEIRTKFPNPSGDIKRKVFYHW